MNQPTRPSGSPDVDAVWRKLDEHTRKFEHLEGQQDDQFESLKTIEVEVARIKVDLSYMREGVEAVKQISQTLDKWKGIALALVVLAQLFGPSIAMGIRVALFGQPPSKSDAIVISPPQVIKP